MGFKTILETIECAEKYRPAFCQAFSDTIICKDLNEANNVCYGGVDRKRWQGATLKGNMVYMAGGQSEGICRFGLSFSSLVFVTTLDDALFEARNEGI